VLVEARLATSRSGFFKGPRALPRHPMSLKHKVKEGLDETRLLILGTQVLFGFKLTSVFQEGFAQLSHATRLVDCAGQFLMALAIGRLIAPSCNITSQRRAATRSVFSERQDYSRE
jgi:hypothetical protein